jgi:putative ABC transport system ATP-binding protein
MTIARGDARCHTTPPLIPTKVRAALGRIMSSYPMNPSLPMDPAHPMDHIDPANPATETAAVRTSAVARAEATIQAENVCRDYRLGQAVVRAVVGITLAIPTGEFLALLGSSGSGKSTLLSMLAGLDRPTSGSIRVGDKNLAELSAENLARYRRETVGMVFQSFNLLPRMTLEENVELPLRLSEIDRRERSSRVREALDRVGLGPRSKHRPSELSGGEQQRGALARALVNRPAILFADEPTGNLDSVNGEQILLLLREFQTTLGMTIVMVTHERPLAERFAGRIVMLHDGKLVSDVATAHTTNIGAREFHSPEAHS